MATKKLLQDRLRWGVGNGRSINIWKDWWIPKLDRAALNPVNELHEDATVSELIDAETRLWKSDMTEAYFGLNVADFIKVILLSRIDADDVLTWTLEHSSIYSVRSGYRFLVRNDQNIPNMLFSLNEDDKK